MYPEKEIVNFWLNRQGFYTVNSIPAGKNKAIDILALKLQDQKVEQVQHIEISCSISPSDNLTLKDYVEKFDNPLIITKLKQYLKDFVGADAPYEKVLVVGHTRRFEELQALEGITVIRFSEILYEVMNNLTRQNYRSEIIRSLQLTKFLLMSAPKRLAMLMPGVMTKPSRERFMNALFEQENVKRILDKEVYEDHIIDLLKSSTLNKPEKLAQRLATEVVGKRSKKKFIEAFTLASDIKPDRHVRKKKQKPLFYYIKK